MLINSILFALMNSRRALRSLFFREFMSFDFLSRGRCAPFNPHRVLYQHPANAAITCAALLACTGCGSAERTQPHTLRASPASAPRTTAPTTAADRISDERTALLIAAYRFELSLHASEEDREEFGAFFLDYPSEQEGEFLAAFARQAPPVRPRRYLRITPGKAIIDAASGSPGISFVAEIKDMTATRGLVQMTWYTDPDTGIGTMMGMEKRVDGWRVRGIEVVWGGRRE